MKDDYYSYSYMEERLAKQVELDRLAMERARGELSDAQDAMELKAKQDFQRKMRSILEDEVGPAEGFAGYPNAGEYS